MKALLTSLVVALLVAGCQSAESKPEPAPPMAQAKQAAPAPQDEAAQKAAEQQAALEARANAAREIAKAQQAEREKAAQEAAARAEAEAAQAAAAEAAKQAAEQAAAQAAAEQAAHAAPVVPPPVQDAPATGQTGATGATAVVNPFDLNVVAEMETSAGTMLIGFLPDIAPQHVKNFVDLARKGFFDGTRFHRTLAGFMIQGGDPFTKDLTQSNRWGTGDPGYKIKAEFSAREHVRGTLSMARGQSPDSAGSQFFICHARAPNLDRQYSVFGELLRGYDVLDKIATAKVGPQPNGEMSRPLEPVQIVKVTIRPRTPDDVKQDG